MRMEPSSPGLAGCGALRAGESDEGVAFEPFRAGENLVGCAEGPKGLSEVRHQKATKMPHRDIQINVLDLRTKGLRAEEPEHLVGQQRLQRGDTFEGYGQAGRKLRNEISHLLFEPGPLEGQV